MSETQKGSLGVPERAECQKSSLAVSIDDVVARAASAVFGRPLVVNVWRAALVETMLEFALPGGWKWCSADYNPHDFEHHDGTRLELKQSAECQSWPKKKTRLASAALFDIAARTQYWNGEKWTDAPSPVRPADIYVLAHHAIVDPDAADHRDPYQWHFYVVSADRLPPTQKISLKSVRGLASEVGFEGLAEAVEESRLTWRSSASVLPDN